MKSDILKEAEEQNFAVIQVDTLRKTGVILKDMVSISFDTDVIFTPETCIYTNVPIKKCLMYSPIVKSKAVIELISILGIYKYIVQDSYLLRHGGLLRLTIDTEHTNVSDVEVTFSNLYFEGNKPVKEQKKDR